MVMMNKLKEYVSKNIGGMLIAIGLAFSIIIILTIGIFQTSRMVAEKEDLISSMEDTLVRVRQEDSSMKASISVLQTSKVKDFLKIKTQDSVINRLQDVVKDYKGKLDQGSVAVMSTTTTINTINPTKVVPGDTVKSVEFAYVYPIYHSSFQLGKWAKGTTSSNKDSTHVTLQTYNEYDVVIGQNNRLFKRPEVYADVITHSPYDSINTFRVYNVAVPKQKRWGVGLQAGYGLPLIPLNLNKPVLYIGIGVSRNLFEF